MAILRWQTMRKLLGEWRVFGDSDLQVNDVSFIIEISVCSKVQCWLFINTTLNFIRKWVCTFIWLTSAMYVYMVIVTVYTIYKWSAYLIYQPTSYLASCWGLCWGYITKSRHLSFVKRFLTYKFLVIDLLQALHVLIVSMWGSVACVCNVANYSNCVAWLLWSSLIASWISVLGVHPTATKVSYGFGRTFEHA